MINVGDQVVWFSQSKRGRVLSFRKGYGTVIKVEDNIATVKTDCNGRVKKPVADLTLKANDTPLSIFGQLSKL